MSENLPISPITGKPSGLTYIVNNSVHPSLNAGYSQPAAASNTVVLRGGSTITYTGDDPQALKIWREKMQPGLYPVQTPKLHAQMVAQYQQAQTQQAMVQQSEAETRLERRLDEVDGKLDQLVSALTGLAQAQRAPAAQVQRAQYAQPQVQRAQYQQQPAYPGQSVALGRLPAQGIQPGGVPDRVHIVERAATSARGAGADAVSGPPTHLQWTRPQFEGPSLHERMIEWAQRRGIQ